jgi:hypothetical protein
VVQNCPNCNKHDWETWYEAGGTVSLRCRGCAYRLPLVVAGGPGAGVAPSPAPGRRASGLRFNRLCGQVAVALARAHAAELVSRIHGADLSVRIADAAARLAHDVIGRAQPP